MAIIKWDPFRDLVNLQEKMNRLFENSLVPRPEGAYSGSWVPAVDVYEVGDDIYIKAELPGVEDDDVIVEVRDNILTIRGERKLEEGFQQENYHRIERTHGRFQRTFALPTEVDEENINASLIDGVLEVILPKSLESHPKKVEINIS